MEPGDDARLRLAAQRHPATPSTGSLHFAQHQLRQVTKAFITLMTAGGNPGAQPLPPPGDREQWPRRHQARQVIGWDILSPDRPVDDWIDTAGTWWRLRYDNRGWLLDAHPLGSPIDAAQDLQRYTDALDDLLRAHRLV